MKTLVIGAARSGTAVAKLLSHHGYEVTICDRNLIEEKEALEALNIRVIEQDTPMSLAEEKFDLVVKNPGIPMSQPLVALLAKSYFIYNEIEIASRLTPNYTYGAITGTNGKTTTTSLLYELLRSQYEDAEYAGNIGKALSEIVDGHEEERHHVALEIAAFQLLGCDRFKPKAATILNLTPDHLDYFSSIDEYYNAKLRIFQKMDASDCFLRNIDDPEIVARTQNLNCQVINFSCERETDAYADDHAVYYMGKKIFDIDTLKIVGRHNIQNAMVSAVMAIHMGVSDENIRRAISAFKGVEHRIEFVRNLDGARYFNDSKATNPEATEVALKAFDLEHVILLAGGYNKRTGFELLRKYCPDVKAMIVYGETKQELQDINSRAIAVDTLQQAVDVASRLAKENDIVLFSPACASYDQFDNYEQRGEIFKELVCKL